MREHPQSTKLGLGSIIIAIALSLCACGAVTLGGGWAFAQLNPKPPPAPPVSDQPPAACGKTDFEIVVEEAAGVLRDLNSRNKPTFQEKLRALKDKRGWTHDQFMAEAAPFVRDDKIAVYDQSTEDLLLAISSLGQEGAAAKTPDCALLLELRGRMKMLVDAQSAKWAYMFEKIDGELAR